MVESLVHKQHEAGLTAKLEELHSADIGYILDRTRFEPALADQNLHFQYPVKAALRSTPMA
jgi:magnesium transporter